MSILINVFKEPLLHGLVQVVLSAFWLKLFGTDLPRFWNYNLNDAFLRPRWALAVLILLGVAGVVVGVGVLLKRLGVLYGYLLLVGMLSFAILIDLLITQ